MMQSSTPLTVAIAGTTERTVIAANALAADPRFQVHWVLTPSPKPVGRQQLLTPNPVHQWATAQQLPLVLIEGKKLDQIIQTAVTQQVGTLGRPDLLLVVDFGYLVPDWLLTLPRVAPLNIHPSKLPRWRGSSPAQYAILFGDLDQAVTLMVMSAGLDEGPIITQWPLPISPSTNATEYYQRAFDEVRAQLAEACWQFAEGNLTPSPQPTSSPTPVAARIAKTDSFVPWELVVSAQAGNSPLHPSNEEAYAVGQLLQTAAATAGNWPTALDRAAKAFYGWPWLWTIVPTIKGEKRMQIRETELKNAAAGPSLVLKQVQIEGQAPAAWNAVKNSLKK